MLLLLALLVGSFLTTTALAQQQGQLQNAERMSKIIGQTAKDQQGQELGEIEDVVVDRQGRSIYLILSGDKVGKSNQFIPIPWQAASPRVQKDAITLNLNQQRLQNAPAFPQDNWGQFNQLEQRVNSYFGAAGAGAAGMPANKSGQAAPGQQKMIPNQQKTTPGQKGTR